MIQRRSVFEVMTLILPAVCDPVTMIRYHCSLRSATGDSWLICCLAVNLFFCVDVAGAVWPVRSSLSAVETAVREEDVERPSQISSEATELIRGLILISLPETFEDSDDWGKEIRIQSGLNVELEKGKIHTSRRRKSVNHGRWVKATASLKDPQQTFKLQILKLPSPQKGVGRYQVTLGGRILATAHQQQWNTGVMLWSISSDAEVDIGASVTVDVTQDILQSENGWVIRILPSVTQSSVWLEDFRLRRVSHAKGSVVRELGEWAEPLVRRQINKLNRELTQKLNRELAKKPDRFEIPLWYASKN